MKPPFSYGFPMGFLWFPKGTPNQLPQKFPPKHGTSESLLVAESQVAFLLIEAKANLNLPETRGSTPLHVTCSAVAGPARTGRHGTMGPWCDAAVERLAFQRKLGEYDTGIV